MIKIQAKARCSGCYACENICPKSCITMQVDEEGFWYPRVDEKNCIACGLCEKACPILNPFEKKVDNNLVAYATIHNDSKIQDKSSSGGVFSVIANYVLENDGVVFGAAFNRDFEVEHRFIEKETELSLLRGSKYVQSKIGQNYLQVEKFLKAGRMVLFTGTPCQVAGLKAYLRKDYDNLITQDFICHGVPSPMVWEKYVNYRVARAGTGIRKISFRHKKYGWERFCVSFSFENDTQYICVLHTDPYMRAFLRNLSLRPSCYNCAFKGATRISDFTLADFWGVKTVEPEMYDKNGVSLVLVHTDKGKEIFSKIKKVLRVKETDCMAALSKNKAALESVLNPKQREEFMYTVRTKDFRKAEKRFLRDSFLIKIKKILSKIKRVIFREKTL